MSTTRNVTLQTSTGTGIQANDQVGLVTPDIGVTGLLGTIAFIREVVSVASFTDGGATSGTYQMQGSVPAGATLLGSKILVPAGFAGDTSATAIVGDGSDTDRYMTGTPNVFATAATGVESGVPSGSKLITTANRPTITVTTAADFTTCKTNAAGSIDVTIYYMQS